MSVYRIPGYEKIVQEHFDLSDKDTFSYLSTIEEADQSKVLVALASKLYKSAVEDKVDQIDFGDIPKSRGDITKLPNYEKVIDCIDIIKGILTSSGQDVTPILTVETAVKYLNENKSIFMRAYQIKSELPVVIYNITVLSIYSSISVLISTCIEFIKSPNGTGFDIVLDKVQLKKTKESLLFKDLNRINKEFQNGNLVKALNLFIKEDVKEISESMAGAAAAFGALSTGAKIAVGTPFVVALIGLITNIIPILRQLSFYAYYARTKVSEYFDAQSALLQMNAYNLAAKASNSDKDVEKIQSKQLKIAGVFKKIANAISIKRSKAEVAVEKDSSSKDKLKISDVKDSDIASSLW